MVKMPDKKLNIALIFIGKQGTGKNIFCDTFGKCILRIKYYSLVDNLDDEYIYHNMNRDGKY